MNVLHSQKPCARYRPLFDSYISNELLIETTHDILHHIEECSECTYEMEQRLQARDMLRRSLSRVHPPAELRSRVQRALRPSTVAPIQRRSALMLQLAAGVAIAVFGVAMFQVIFRHPDAWATLLDLGWGQHVHCTLNGHYAADPPSRAEMTKRLGKTYASLLSVTDEKLPGYRIRDAHRCLWQGRVFAHLVLQKDSTIVSVSILKKGDSDHLSPHVFQSATRDRGEIVAYQTPSHVVYVMGNQTEGEMQAIARLIEPDVRALAN